MGKLTINYTNGALNGASPSIDAISALVFCGTFTLTSITGLTAISGSSILQVTSLESAEAAGITSALNPIVNHQIANFFTIKPDGSLYVAFLSNSASTYSTELLYIQKFVEGKINNFGIYDTRVLSDTIVGNINTALTGLKAVKMNAVGVIGMNTSAATYTSLTDFSASAYSNVGVVLAQDGNSTLSGGTNGSVPEVGAVLGAIANMSVNVSPAYNRLNKFDSITTAPALGNGVNINTLSDSYLETNVDNKNYIRFQKYVGDNSVYLNQSFTATSRVDDYNSIERNRTINKAARQINLYLSTELNAPIQLTADGYITASRVNELQVLAGTGLATMKGNGEISAYKVFIDPTQNILGTNTLYVVVKIVPYATANEIVVSLGFASSVS
jgi:hypothetical protein